MIPTGADARRADLVDGLRRDLLGDAALDLRLARGDLALPGLQHLTHHDVLHLLGCHLGPLERSAIACATEVGGVERREGPAELAERGARGTEDHGLWHLDVSSHLGRKRAEV